MHKQKNKEPTFWSKYKIHITVLVAASVIVYSLIYLVFRGNGIFPVGADLEKNDWLSFLGAYLSFIGTVIISMIAIFQNRYYSESNEKKDAANRKKEVQPIFSVKIVAIDAQLDGTAEAFSLSNKSKNSVHKNVKISVENVNRFPIKHVIIFDIQTIRTEEHEPVKPAEKINFRITDDALGHGGPKAKFRMNINAIRALKAIESEQRLATADEQEALSRYVGWGGCADAFDEAKENWSSEYAELNGLLTEEEYESARASVLNAHYTSPIVIKAIYKAIENMGFRTGNILEPSCGIGNFFGLLPESMAGSKLYGIELDSITGRIAKQLYQNANIAIQGYEGTALPDSFFDVAIGNVPFGDYGVADKRYDKNHFLIHDYFIAKTLDKVRPGGIIAFVTSSGTMDKKNPSVRKYIAQRADLLGAVRLPNNAFLANAGTGVVADILFLQKRDRPMEVEPAWVHLGKTDSGYTINQYFVDNPDMVLGELTEGSTQYGKQAVTVKPTAGAELPEQLSDAIANIHAKITEPEQFEEAEENIGESIPADPNVRNFSFTVVDGDIYYRENSVMHKVELSVTAENRIKGMVKIRDCTRKLIEYQLEGYSDDLIRQEQQTLNRLYDKFTAQYGLLNSRANNTAFSDDSSYCLLCSLEVLDENGALVRKADMFSKRTIRQQEPVTSCDTAADALAVSLSEKAKVDLQYMGKLTGKTEEQLTEDLAGIIFFNPSSEQYETADEYLSGDVRWKLRLLKEIDNPKYATNMEALEKVQPNNLTASEIDVRLGATWIPPEDIQRFVIELLKPAYYASSKIKVHYSRLTAQWSVSGKTSDYGNVTANVTYGTKRINAYKIIEETLNLKDVRIFDTVYDESSGEKRILNRNETVLAQQKQQLIKDAFRDWIWKDPDRRDRLTTLYNTKFNSIRSREYDGSHIRFIGTNPEITLRQHQMNAVARVIYGGNTLLAHVVGAGKTFTMAASAMESKRLGLCQKSLFVVPNHLTEQWAAEFLQLYPSANILVATKKDFETRNRKKFCSRIATGDYDAVIIGHSQFEKIPMSLERQRVILQTQLNEIIDGISEAKRENAERFTIKQMEKSRRSIKLKLDKLNDQTRKDDVVTFEELGVDRLFVDEAHSFKNLFLYTKMRNVAGLSQTEALKSSDLFMKCRYMDELTGNRGIVFATGTPISNSMTEMYTMQRYLQYDALCSHGLQHFDAWASTFGETITAMELAPEGTGYRAKTRFARFYNLPELITMFRQVADVQTADMLKLPVPEAEYHNEVIKPSGFQKEKFISQIMTSKSPVRSCEDVDETALSYAEIKALATGNPYIREKMDLEIEVSRLKLVKANYLSQKYMLEDSLLKHYPKEIRLTQERIKGYAMDIALYERHKSEDFPGMLLYGTHYEEKKEAGTAILEACKAMTSPEPKEVGSYRGFTLLLSYDIVAKVFRMTLRGELSHTVELGSDIHGNIQRMENVLESLPSRLSACEKALATLKEQMENAKAEVEKPFEQEQELSEKAARLAELNALLNMDKRENAALDAEPEHTEIETVKASCKER